MWRLAFPAVLGIAVVSSAGALAQDDMRTISPQQPGVVLITSASPTAIAPPPQGAILLALDRFSPHPVRSSELVIRDAANGKEIGRVGIFPNDAFLAGNGQSMMMFVPLPAGVTINAGSRVKVSIEPADTSPIADFNASVVLKGIFAR